MCVHVVLIVSFTYECCHTDSNSEASGNSHMLCGVLEASSGGALEPRGNRLSEELKGCTFDTADRTEAADLHNLKK